MSVWIQSRSERPTHLAIANDQAALLISRHEHDLLVHARIELLRAPSQLLLLTPENASRTLLSAVTTCDKSVTGRPFSSTWWKT